MYVRIPVTATLNGIIQCFHSPLLGWGGFRELQPGNLIAPSSAGPPVKVFIHFWPRHRLAASTHPLTPVPLVLGISAQRGGRFVGV